VFGWYWTSLVVVTDNGCSGGCLGGCGVRAVIELKEFKNNNAYLVLENCDLGELASYLSTQPNRSLSEDGARYFMKQLGMPACQRYTLPTRLIGECAHSHQAWRCVVLADEQQMDCSLFVPMAPSIETSSHRTSF
jgi:hypothetical protein